MYFNPYPSNKTFCIHTNICGFTIKVVLEFLSIHHGTSCICQKALSWISGRTNKSNTSFVNILVQGDINSENIYDCSFCILIICLHLKTIMRRIAERYCDIVFGLQWIVCHIFMNKLKSNKNVKLVISTYSEVFLKKKSSGAIYYSMRSLMKWLLDLSTLFF